MKKTMMALMMLLVAVTGKAMSYEQARNEALFLTDKMAYELNLTDAQYEAAYEINLDYLMGVTSYDDVFGTYWERRNLDLSYVLLDWQWTSFCAATYFYRPLYWDAGYWHFGIYARYPHRDYFYFGRPVFYASYRGGHAWHHVGGHGYYYGRREHFRPAAGRTHFGMLDRWNRGDFRSYHSSGHTYRNFGGSRNSSTRTTVGSGSHGTGRTFGSTGTSTERSTGRTFGSNGGSRSITDRSSINRSNTMSRESSINRENNVNRSSINRSNINRGSYSSSRSSMAGSRSSGSFSRSTPSSSHSGSFSRGSGSFSRGSGSFGGGHSGSFSRGSGSFGGGHSGGGGHSSSGGRSFGGHR